MSKQLTWSFALFSAILAVAVVAAALLWHRYLWVLINADGYCGTPAVRAWHRLTQWQAFLIGNVAVSSVMLFNGYRRLPRSFQVGFFSLFTLAIVFFLLRIVFRSIYP